MITKITNRQNQNLKNIINYLQKEDAELLCIQNSFGGMNAFMNEIEDLIDATKRPDRKQIKEPVIHFVLSYSKEIELTNAEHEIIASEFMKKLGYGEQPYCVVKHNDTDIPHIHIVSSRISVKNFKKINNAHEFRRMQTIRKMLMQKYNIPFIIQEKEGKFNHYKHLIDDLIVNRNIFTMDEIIKQLEIKGIKCSAKEVKSNLTIKKIVKNKRKEKKLTRTLYFLHDETNDKRINIDNIDNYSFLLANKRYDHVRAAVSKALFIDRKTTKESLKKELQQSNIKIRNFNHVPILEFEGDQFSLVDLGIKDLETVLRRNYFNEFRQNVFNLNSISMSFTKLGIIQNTGKSMSEELEEEDERQKLKREL